MSRDILPKVFCLVNSNRLKPSEVVTHIKSFSQTKNGSGQHGNF